MSRAAAVLGGLLALGMPWASRGEEGPRVARLSAEAGARRLPARSEVAAPGPGSAGPVMVATVSLLAVAGGAAWYARRVGPVGRAGAGGAVEVIGRAAVGPRQGVVVVRVGAEKLVLGVGGQGPPALLARIAESEAEGPLA